MDGPQAEYYFEAGHTDFLVLYSFLDEDFDHTNGIGPRAKKEGGEDGGHGGPASCEFELTDEG